VKEGERAAQAGHVKKKMAVRLTVATSIVVVKKQVDRGTK
jgi:hypothetical protein